MIKNRKNSYYSIISTVAWDYRNVICLSYFLYFCIYHFNKLYGKIYKLFAPSENNIKIKSIKPDLFNIRCRA